MGKPVPALDYLADADPNPPQAVNVVFGEDVHLQRKVVQKLTKTLAAGPDAEFAVSRFDGDAVEWRDVKDQLATIAMFGGGRSVVVIQQADDLVSKERGRLEDYVAGPDTDGALILAVKTWPKNTRLYKALASRGLQIDCKTPSAKVIVKWLNLEAKRSYDVRLTAGAAEQMIEILGPELGMLEQELEKLALLADGKISVQLVRDMAGGWRAKTAWDMLDAALAGNTPQTLAQLERLIQAGEHPIAILAQISASLRRLAAASRVFLDAAAAGRKATLRTALEQAGVAPYFLPKTEQQLRRLGRRRASSLYAWLLEADLQLKSESSAADRARLVLERLLVKIAADEPNRQPASV
jgi:DNA polymerase-3 subunit delta